MNEDHLADITYSLIDFFLYSVSQHFIFKFSVPDWRTKKLETTVSDSWYALDRTCPLEKVLNVLNTCF